MKMPVGWPTQQIDCVMRQGASGTIRVRLVVVGDEGAPLPSYDGFTASLVLTRLPGHAAVLTLVPQVVPTAEEQRLTIDITFATADTLSVPEGRIGGALCLHAPSGERNYPVALSIDLVRV